ncbi:MAG: SdiA-regulated domain-containing protein [Melioribacteraceae bacterium]|nr:SdiA-regulated domain-containing protein [Melioribacteraceae bacterium]
MKNLLKITLLLLLFFGCTNKKETKDNLSDLTFLKSVKLQIPEPSGITFFNNSLWIVSDDESSIFNVDTLGNILNTIPVDGKDLEGITNTSDSVIVIILERDRKVIALDLDGKELHSKTIDITGELNYGLEGIGFNQVKRNFYVLNEKNPLLIIELDENFEELSRKEIQFAKDISGITYDENRDVYWVTSDESNSINFCNHNFEVIKEYKVNIPQIEGIAIDLVKNRLYVVSDRTESLYIYQINR